MNYNAFEAVRLLGLRWAANRKLYDTKMRLGLFRVRTPIKEWERGRPGIVGEYFKGFDCNFEYDSPVVQKVDHILRGYFSFFSCKEFLCKLPPNWFLNPFYPSVSNEKELQKRHWSDIQDFSYGDIKCIWELSRFSWVYHLVRAYHDQPREKYAHFFWKMIGDWAQRNTPNKGVHWKCGQEISVRMFALVTGYFGFQNSDTSNAGNRQLLATILSESAHRIEANIDYALNQKNNHGISEAAGLFTAGVLLGDEKWKTTGRRLLESQAQELIYEDGSFSQHSANYHRAMLHAYIWAISLGRANGVAFSDELMDQMRKAGKWLLVLYDPQTGRMPNLGSNDGALILPYSVCDYLDFRPTIQAVGAVVERQRWISSGPWDDMARWLVPEFDKFNSEANEEIVGRSSVTPSDEQGTNPQLQILKTGGYAIFSHRRSKLVFRCPERFHHRPAQCDLLHVDFWAGGVNILRDAGTYSYNCPQPWQDYFKSVSAHNTIQFDDHDQMPKISRFLYGKWPKLNVEASSENNNPIISAGFRDWKGCSHFRKVETLRGGYRITDQIAGFKKKAVLRWRLAPEVFWELIGSICRTDWLSIHIEVDNGLNGVSINTGWESLYYMNRSEIQVLETSVLPSCSTITTTLRLN